MPTHGEDLLNPSARYATVFDAAAAGDVPAVDHFITHCGVSPAAGNPDDRNWTLLHYAAHNGHAHLLFDYLLSSSLASSTIATATAATAIVTPPQSQRQQQQQHLGLLLSVDVQADKQWTPLYVAVRNGKTDIARRLIEDFGANVRMRNSNGANLVHAAASGGFTEPIPMLMLEHGLDPCEADTMGFRPMLCAANNGWLHVIKFLVDVVGQSPLDTFGTNGTTSLHYAAGYGHFPIVKYLTTTAFQPTSDSGRWQRARQAFLLMRRHQQRVRWCSSSSSSGGGGGMDSVSATAGQLLPLPAPTFATLVGFLLKAAAPPITFSTVDGGGSLPSTAASRPIGDGGGALPHTSPPPDGAIGGSVASPRPLHLTADYNADGVSAAAWATSTNDHVQDSVDIRSRNLAVCRYAFEGDRRAAAKKKKKRRQQQQQMLLNKKQSGGADDGVEPPAFSGAANDNDGDGDDANHHHHRRHQDPSSNTTAGAAVAAAPPPLGNVQSSIFRGQWGDSYLVNAVERGYPDTSLFMIDHYLRKTHHPCGDEGDEASYYSECDEDEEEGGYYYSDLDGEDNDGNAVHQYDHAAAANFIFSPSSPPPQQQSQSPSSVSLLRRPYALSSLSLRHINATPLTPHGLTALHLACRAHNMALSKRLLSLMVADDDGNDANLLLDGGGGEDVNGTGDDCAAVDDDGDDGVVGAPSDRAAADAHSDAAAVRMAGAAHREGASISSLLGPMQLHHHHSSQPQPQGSAQTTSSSYAPLGTPQPMPMPNGKRGGHYDHHAPRRHVVDVAFAVNGDKLDAIYRRAAVIYSSSVAAAAANAAAEAALSPTLLCTAVAQHHRDAPEEDESDASDGASSFGEEHDDDEVSSSDDDIGAVAMGRAGEEEGEEADNANNHVFVPTPTDGEDASSVHSPPSSTTLAIAASPLATTEGTIIIRQSRRHRHQQQQHLRRQQRRGGAGAGAGGAAAGAAVVPPPPVAQRGLPPPHYDGVDGWTPLHFVAAAITDTARYSSQLMTRYDAASSFSSPMMPPPPPVGADDDDAVNFEDDEDGDPWWADAEEYDDPTTNADADAIVDGVPLPTSPAIGADERAFYGGGGGGGGANIISVNNNNNNNGSSSSLAAHSLLTSPLRSPTSAVLRHRKKKMHRGEGQQQQQQQEDDGNRNNRRGNKDALLSMMSSAEYLRHLHELTASRSASALPSAVVVGGLTSPLRSSPLPEGATATATAVTTADSSSSTVLFGCGDSSCAVVHTNDAVNTSRDDDDDDNANDAGGLCAEVSRGNAPAAAAALVGNGGNITASAARHKKRIEIDATPIVITSPPLLSTPIPTTTETTTTGAAGGGGGGASSPSVSSPIAQLAIPPALPSAHNACHAFIQLLVQNGADPNQTDVANATALDVFLEYFLMGDHKMREAEGLPIHHTSTSTSPSPNVAAVRPSEAFADRLRLYHQNAAVCLSALLASGATFEHHFVRRKETKSSSRGEAPPTTCTPTSVASVVVAAGGQLLKQTVHDGILMRMSSHNQSAAALSFPFCTPAPAFASNGTILLRPNTTNNACNAPPSVLLRRVVLRPCMKRNASFVWEEQQQEEPHHHQHRDPNATTAPAAATAALNESTASVLSSAEEGCSPHLFPPTSAAAAASTLPFSSRRRTTATLVATGDVTLIPTAVRLLPLRLRSLKVYRRGLAWTFAEEPSPLLLMLRSHLNDDEIPWGDE